MAWSWCGWRSRRRNEPALPHRLAQLAALAAQRAGVARGALPALPGAPAGNRAAYSTRYTEVSPIYWTPFGLSRAAGEREPASVKGAAATRSGRARTRGRVFSLRAHAPRFPSMRSASPGGERVWGHFGGRGFPLVPLRAARFARLLFGHGLDTGRARPLAAGWIVPVRRFVSRGWARSAVQRVRPAAWRIGAHHIARARPFSWGWARAFLVALIAAGWLTVLAALAQAHPLQRHRHPERLGTPQLHVIRWAQQRQDVLRASRCRPSWDHHRLRSIPRSHRLEARRWWVQLVHEERAREPGRLCRRSRAWARTPGARCVVDARGVEYRQHRKWLLRALAGKRGFPARLWRRSFTGAGARLISGRAGRRT